MSHARLAPSKAERVLACAASVEREARIPEEPGGLSAQQGTNAHWVLEQALLEDQWPPTCIGDGGNDFIAQLPHSVAGLPPELRDQAHDCFWYAKTRRVEMGEGTVLSTESKVNPEYFTGRPDSSGTVDVALVSPAMLEVIDLKTGGILVEADAPQLKLYALGKMAEYVDPTTGFAPFETVRLTVFQPKRPGSETIERSIDYTQQQLLEWAQMVWYPAACATDDPNAVGTPTEDGCRYCTAKAHGSCPEYTAAVSGTAQMLFKPIEATPATQDIDPMMTAFTVTDLTPEQVSKFLEIWPLMKARGKDVEERAFELLKSRVAVPGFKLVEGRSGMQWSCNDEEMTKKLKNLKLTLDQAQPRRLISPAQIMKIGLPTKKLESVKKHIVTKRGGLTIVPANDKRVDAMPAVSFQPVGTPAEVPPTLVPSVDMSFLNL